MLNKMKQEEDQSVTGKKKGFQNQKCMEIGKEIKINGEIGNK